MGVSLTRPQRRRSRLVTPKPCHTLASYSPCQPAPAGWHHASGRPSIGHLPSLESSTPCNLQSSSIARSLRSTSTVSCTSCSSWPRQQRPPPLGLRSMSCWCLTAPALWASSPCTPCAKPRAACCVYLAATIVLASLRSTTKSRWFCRSPATTSTQQVPPYATFSHAALQTSAAAGSRPSKCCRAMCGLKRYGASSCSPMATPTRASSIPRSCARWPQPRKSRASPLQRSASTMATTKCCWLRLPMPVPATTTGALAPIKHHRYSPPSFRAWLRLWPRTSRSSCALCPASRLQFSTNTRSPKCQVACR